MGDDGVDAALSFHKGGGGRLPKRKMARPQGVEDPPLPPPPLPPRKDSPHKTIHDDGFKVDISKCLDAKNNVNSKNNNSAKSAVSKYYISNLPNNLKDSKSSQSDRISNNVSGDNNNNMLLANLRRLVAPTGRKGRRRVMLLAFGLFCFVVGVILSASAFKYLNNRRTAVSSIVTNNNSARLHFKNERVLRDVFISVKTTKKYHHPRLVIQLETWVPLVKEQTHFFTDLSDPEMSARVGGGRLLETACSDSHTRTALACKMAAEFDAFLKSLKR